MSDPQTPGGAPPPIPPSYYRPGVQPPGRPARPGLQGSQADAPTSGSLRRWIPGFRSGHRSKAAIACVFYACCLLLIIWSLLTAQWATAVFSTSLLAIGVLAVFLISYWRVRPANVAILGALLVTVAACGLSVAYLPPQPAASGQNSPSMPGPTPIAEATPSPTPIPTATPSPTPTPTPTRAPTTAPIPMATHSPAAAKDLCGAASNPWGYNFCGGSTISEPPDAFCQYFSCIGKFWKGQGYVIECSDGMYSRSGGIQGSCSSHGGNLRPLYQ